MPIYHDVEQGSDQWLALHMGIPTMSQAHRIMTPEKRKLSSQSIGYIHEKLVEMFLGVPYDGTSTEFMRRGTKLESKAVDYYEFATGLTTKPVGFVTSDDGTVGASPDRLVGDEGLLEVKAFGAKHHIAALLDDDKDYFIQMQGQLWISGRQWCDRLYFYPDMEIFPSIIKRVERDEDYISDLGDAVADFNQRLWTARDTLLARGCKPCKQPEPIIYLQEAEAA